MFALQGYRAAKACYLCTRSDCTAAKDAVYSSGAPRFRRESAQIGSSRSAAWIRLEQVWPLEVAQALSVAGSAMLTEARWREGRDTRPHRRPKKKNPNGFAIRRLRLRRLKRLIMGRGTQFRDSDGLVCNIRHGTLQGTNPELRSVKSVYQYGRGSDQS